MANLGETLYLYRQHIASVCATLGQQWPIYRDHILELAGERRRNGKDRLENGGTLSTPTTSLADARRNEWQVYLNWAGHALTNGNARLSWRYACAAVARRPVSKAGWKMLLRILLRASPAKLIKKVG